MSDYYSGEQAREAQNRIADQMEHGRIHGPIPHGYAAPAKPTVYPEDQTDKPAQFTKVGTEFVPYSPARPLTSNQIAGFSLAAGIIVGGAALLALKPR